MQGVHRRSASTASSSPAIRTSRKPIASPSSSSRSCRCKATTGIARRHSPQRRPLRRDHRQRRRARAPPGRRRLKSRPRSSGDHHALPRHSSARFAARRSGPARFVLLEPSTCPGRPPSPRRRSKIVRIGYQKYGTLDPAQGQRPARAEARRRSATGSVGRIPGRARSCSRRSTPARSTSARSAKRRRSSPRRPAPT